MRQEHRVLRSCQFSRWRFEGESSPCPHHSPVPWSPTSLGWEL